MKKLDTFKDLDNPYSNEIPKGLGGDNTNSAQNLLDPNRLQFHPENKNDQSMVSGYSSTVIQKGGYDSQNRTVDKPIDPFANSSGMAELIDQNSSIEEEINLLNGQQVPNDKADQLAHMIEHEFNRLETKHKEISTQLEQKQTQVAKDRKRYMLKIERLKKLRDDAMEKYEAKVISPTKI